ncbi:MAG TPA: glycosyltransferase family 4 protein [Thermoleophilaceae bacterium]|nr:glycosyltransferase family 4 protein [Thermoleophilaceae bacterium]
MRVQLIDPSADVAPYDHALARALAARGAEVELVTSRFVHGPAPEPAGYSVSTPFHRLATRTSADAPRRRRALRLLEHVPDMLRYRGHAGEADVRHYQWLPLPRLDARLLPRARPSLLTLHNVLRAERLEQRLLERMDAVIVLTRAGAEVLTARHGIPQERVRVIPHGAFEHLTTQAHETPLPDELRHVEGPVVLCFGVVRPYKGVDVLLEAFRDVEAELWVVGRPLGESMERLRRLAPAGKVRFVSRYVGDRELPAFFRRADLLVLPHRRVDVSGVLFAGLAFGKPMVLSDVGGFRDVVEEHGAGRLVPPEDPEALGAAIRGLLDDGQARAELAARARAAADGPYAWSRVACQTLNLYEEVLR